MAAKPEHSPPDANPPDVDPPAKRRRFRWRRWLMGAVLLALFIWLLPSIIAITPLRNVVLDGLLGDANWEASAEQMSLSWVEPLSVRGVRMTSREGPSQFVLDSLESEKTWWRIMWDRPALGHLAVDDPHLDLLLGNALPLARRRATDVTLVAAVDDAGLTLRVPGEEDPPFDLDGFDVTVKIQNTDAGRELIVEPIMLLDRQQLTEQLCSRGLQLIAPILAETTRVDGQVSLQLDTFRIPLDVAGPEQVSQADVSGRLALHRVEVGPRNPLIAKLVQLMARLFEVPVPDRIRIADESEIAFRLIDGRVHHTGLAFGLPTISEDLVFRTSGSVGFDESLDLLVEVPLLGEMLGEGPIARRLAGRKLRVEVGGTIERPELTFPKGELILQNLLAKITGGEEGEPIDVVEATETAVGIARDLIAARREARQAASAREADTNGEDTDAAVDPNEPDEPDARRPLRRPIRRLLDRLIPPPSNDPESGQ